MRKRAIVREGENTMSTKGPDDLDRRLLAALRTDGRASAATLSRLLGVGRATVTARIDRLVDAGVIVGFTVRVRNEVATDAITAMTLIDVEGHNADHVIRSLRGREEITALHSTNGSWDLVAELTAPSLGDLDSLLGYIRAIEGVRRSQTNIFLSSVLR